MSPPRSTPSRRVDLCIVESFIHTHSSLRPPIEAADSPQTLTMVRLSSTPANVIARRLAAPSLRIVGGLILIGLQVDGAGAAQPTLPAADLIVQIRMVSDAELAADVATSDATESAAKQGLSISNSADESASARTQEIRVRNGESASMSCHKHYLSSGCRRRNSAAGRLGQGAVGSSTAWSGCAPASPCPCSRAGPVGANRCGWTFDSRSNALVIGEARKSRLPVCRHRLRRFHCLWVSGPPSPRQAPHSRRSTLPSGRHKR